MQKIEQALNWILNWILYCHWQMHSQKYTLVDQLLVVSGNCVSYNSLMRWTSIHGRPGREGEVGHNIRVMALQWQWWPVLCSVVLGQVAVMAKQSQMLDTDGARNTGLLCEAAEDFFGEWHLWRLLAGHTDAKSCPATKHQPFILMLQQKYICLGAHLPCKDIFSIVCFNRRCSGSTPLIQLRGLN